ncbi:MAG: hypothetical protein NTX14_03285 [Candidatus Nealsonbacteria bacterium]|nr:hypothetical protein [Candidatus Nealsonbacteria bacterium]
MDEKNRKKALRQLKKEYKTASTKKGKEKILAELAGLATTFKDCINIAVLATQGEVLTPKAVITKMSDLAKTFAECSHAFHLASWSGNINAAMTALGKISYLYEEGKLKPSQKKLYYGMSAWADSLSGKMPNA